MDSKVAKKSQKMRKETLDEKKRDRGDNLKKQDSIKSKISDLGSLKAARKPPLPDRGDVPIINKVTKIPKTINATKIDKVSTENARKEIENKTKQTADVSPKANTEAETTSLSKTSEINTATVNKTKGRERIVTDKFNVKHKVFYIQNQTKDKNVVKSELKTDRLKNELSLKSGSKDIMSDSVKTQSINTESDVVKKEKVTTSHRKPMIKTIKSKNDNKVYKAVTFTEQRRSKPTVLEINIPNIQAKKTKTKLVDKNLEAKLTSSKINNNKSASKLTIKDKLQHQRRNRLTERIKRKRLNRCVSSPDKFKKAESPPTEVAKWAPSCLNAHTKPYYEAWVNTTLAAISKTSNKDKQFFEKQNIIKSFQKSLELREPSPDLVYENCANECYTGKIKIKQKNLSRRMRQPLIAPLFDKDYTA